MTIRKPVRRRAGDSGCQWLAIGMTLGIGCSLVFCLASYIAGFIEFKGLDSGSPTDTAARIITAEVSATPLQSSPTLTPTSEAETVETEEAAVDTQTGDSASDVDAAPSFTPSATALGSGAASPTRLPEIGTGGGAATTDPLVSRAADDEVGTAVPLGGNTPVPQIGSGNGLPEQLVSLASPLVEIPGGTFTMGTTNEEGLAAVEACVVRDGGSCTEAFIQDSVPAHQVTLNDFMIEIFEVSVDQYVAFLNSLLVQNPGVRVDLIGCGGQPCILTQEEDPNSIIRFNGSEYEIVNAAFYTNHPVFFVTWYGADTYCRTIGRRLPTEAEWERAARGPANSVYPWGPEWVAENSNTSRSGPGLTSGGTVTVDTYPSGSSAYGPLNMAGNVSEWVADFYQPTYYSLPAAAGPNPTGAVSSETRVVRGGGWDNVPLFARTVHRMDVDPKQPRASLGFRCAANSQ